MVVLTDWFTGTRSRATGILLMASSLGGVLFPLVLGAGFTAHGWRITMLGVGVGTGALMISSALLLLRDSPYRSTLSKREPLGANTEAFRGGLTDALKQIKFYKVLFLTGSLWFVIIALTQHQAIYLTQDIGFSKSPLPSVFSLFFWVLSGGQIGLWDFIGAL